MGMKKAIFSIFTEYRFFIHYGISVFIILLILPALRFPLLIFLSLLLFDPALLRSKKVQNLPAHLLCILPSQYHRHCI